MYFYKMMHNFTKLSFATFQESGQLELGAAIKTCPMGVTLFKAQTEGVKKGITAGKLSSQVTTPIRDPLTSQLALDGKFNQQKTSCRQQ